MNSTPTQLAAHRAATLRGEHNDAVARLLRLERKGQDITDGPVCTM